jgi:hypothetical protein
LAVSDAELEKALRSVARLIDRYCDAYWPLFERLEHRAFIWTHSPRL